MAFAAIAEKIRRETGIHGIVVNSRIINAFGKEIRTLYVEPRTMKKKSGDFGVRQMA